MKKAKSIDWKTIKRRIYNYSGSPVALTKYFIHLADKIILKLSGKKGIDPKEDLRYKQAIEGKTEIKKNILGSKMILPVADKGLSKDLIIEGIREKEVLKLIQELEKEGNSLVKPDDNVIEIGANIGYYALQWAKIIQKGKGKVWAIEPNPQAFEYLKKNISLNKYNRVFFLNKGLSNKKGKMFFLEHNNWNLSKILSEKEANTNSTKINIDTLDNLFSGKEINLIRMDVEGHEYNILKGGIKILKENPNLKILMEYHPHELTTAQKKDLIKILKDSGFKIKYCVDLNGRIKKARNLSILKTSIHPYHFLFMKNENKK